ncbi:MAG TPA: hypothetical protein VNW68_05150 [Candidatus Limnocylindria bacterium]|nr:hypothetical protein [Candidatus Limnocylindria bacterium]
MSRRSLQQLTAVLALVLLVFAGTLSVVLLMQDRAPASPTPTPASVATVQPAPTEAGPPTASPPDPTDEPSPGEPTAKPTKSPKPPKDTPTPTADPEPTPADRPTPTADPSPSPTASPVAGAAQQLRMLRMGLDPQSLEDAVARVITFDVDGPGEISVTLTDVTAGRARTCLWRGGPGNARERECANLGEGGSLQRSVAADQSGPFSVSLVGVGQRTPLVTLTISFPAATPTARLSGFRFQGTEPSFDGFNGFDLQVTPRNRGRLQLDARLQGGAQSYRLRIDEGGTTVLDQSGDRAAEVSWREPVDAGTAYRLRFENNAEIAQEAIFVSATISWP